MIIYLFEIACLIAIGFFCFRGLLKSTWFNSFADAIFGPEDSEELLNRLDALEEVAQQKATENEQLATKRLEGAKKIRNRLNGDR